MPLSIVDIMNFTNYFSVLSLNKKIRHWSDFFINRHKEIIPLFSSLQIRENYDIRKTFASIFILKFNFTIGHNLQTFHLRLLSIPDAF